MSDYKRNPRGARRARKSMGRKAIVVLSLMMVLVLAAVGGTIAWLTDKTDPVTNTFSTSDIEIDLYEHVPGSDGVLTTEETRVGYSNYKMVPGYTIAKDPVALVKTNSEPCYLFVKVVEGNNFGTFMTYTIAEGWTQLKDADNKDVAGVFYRVVNTADMGTPYPVLANNQVSVKDTVTKTTMSSVTDTTKPTLTFTAYASQLYKSNSETFTAFEAWGNCPQN